MKRIYIYLPEINAIVKRKGFEKLNDFEQLCFLFKNNDEDGILKTEERLVKKVMEKYRKFQDAEDLWSIAMATQIQEQREKMPFWIVSRMVLNKGSSRELNRVLNRGKKRVKECC